MAREWAELRSSVCNSHTNMSTAIGTVRQDSVDVKFRPKRTVRIESKVTLPETKLPESG